MTKTFRSACLFSLILLVATSCKTTKTTSVDAHGKASKTSKESVIKDVLAQELNFKTITAKVDIELTQGSKSRKTGSVVKIIKDSVIQISVRPILGLEVFRITFTPDSLFVVDRLQKKYVAEDSQTFQEKLHFNFYNFQALLTNALFVPNEQEVNNKNIASFNVEAASNNYLISNRNKKGTMFIFSIDGSDKIGCTSILDANNNSIQWVYSRFVKDDQLHQYPTKIDAKIEAKNKKFDLSLSYNKLDIDANPRIDYSISSKYTKIPIENVINILLTR